MSDKEYRANRVVRGIATESGAEYVMPDYNGDIKKILYTDARVIPSASFTVGDSLEYSGIIAYCVLYVDTEGKVCRAEFTSDYEGTVRDIPEGCIESDVTNTLIGYTVRPVGPRKLSCRASMTGTACIYLEAAVCEDVEADGEVEKRERTLKIRTGVLEKKPEREYACELARLEGVIADEVEILLTRAEIKDKKCTFDESGAEYSAVIAVSALIKVGAAPLMVEVCEIPFVDRFFEVAQPYVEYTDAYMEAVTDVSSIKCVLTPEENGVALAASVIIENKVAVNGNVGVPVMIDAYAVGCDTQLEYNTLEYSELLGHCVAGFKVSESFGKDSLEACELRNVVISDAEIKVGEITLGESPEICGEVRFNTVACQVNADGGAEYVPLRFNVPFKHNVNNSCHYPENARLDVRALVTDMELTLAQDTLRVCAVCEVSLAAAVDRECKYISVVSATAQDAENDECVVTVYYPQGGESLFDVAKKYKVSMLRLASVNKIAEDVFNNPDATVHLSGIDKIIIR